MPDDTGERSDLSRLLSSLRWTLETHVAPHVQGSLPQSYVRTLIVMLEHAERKSVHEWQALREDLSDLDAVMIELGLGRGGAPVEIDGLSSACLETEIARRDPVLAEAFEQLDAAQRRQFDDFLLRRIERQRRYMPDNVPSNLF